MLRANHLTCVSEVAIDRDLTVARFGKAFPDANQWLEAFGKRLKIRALVKMLDYKLPAEYLTMYMCLSGDMDIINTPVTWLEKHALGLAVFRRLTARDVELHPAVLISQYAKQVP